MLPLNQIQPTHQPKRKKKNNNNVYNYNNGKIKNAKTSTPKKTNWYNGTALLQPFLRWSYEAEECFIG